MAQESYKDICFSVFMNIFTSLKAVASGRVPARQTREHPSLQQLCTNVIIGMG